jgi:hypothetical protein
MATAEERRVALEGATPSITQLAPEAQGTAVRVLLGADQPTSNKLWFIVIPGIIALAALLTVFVFVLEADNKKNSDAATLLPVLTFVVGAFVGIFAPSPSSAGQKPEE